MKERSMLLQTRTQVHEIALVAEKYTQEELDNMDKVYREFQLSCNSPSC